MHKIKSVLELSKFKVGEPAWWLKLRRSEPPDLPKDNQWMLKHHPKILYNGPYKRLMKVKSSVPKVSHQDFIDIISIITSTFNVEIFPVCQIIRSRDTGEFFYSNDNDEWAPESSLFTTAKQAAKEKQRILNMLRKWLNKNADNKND